MSTWTKLVILAVAILAVLAVVAWFETDSAAARAFLRGLLRQLF